LEKKPKAIAFADDLILVTRGKTVVELTKITAWTRDYKIEFNDDKSTAMLVSRRKRNERKK